MKGDFDTRLEGSLHPGDLGPEGERELDQREGLLLLVGVGRQSGTCGSFTLHQVTAASVWLHLDDHPVLFGLLP